MRFPNLFTAAGAVWRVFCSVFKREPVLVSEEVSNARLNTCYACEQYAPDDGQCKICTCYVEIKSQLSTEKCPIGKW